ncbi:MAG: hypothetical protein M1816_002983 [Peltula sp. TS41687]|nr:MAG: hypothetical protein M1816_002983 [Peltula sp. TS41687]
MSSHLFDRALGSTTPHAFSVAYTTKLVHALQLAPNVQFDGRDEQQQQQPQTTQRGGGVVWAHRDGVNSVVADHFEGRLLLSGGADPSILLWDLDVFEKPQSGHHGSTYRPVGSESRKSGGHRFGITHLSFYPFDMFAFLSSSYDHCLKIHSTETMTPSASFDLDSVVYSHALSPIASHVLVACATQHPVVRLVDLKSGDSTHSLAGHAGAVLSVAWSPRDENLLCSGSIDGTVRLWDVRRSASCLGVLDMAYNVEMPRSESSWTGRGSNRTHVGPVNGVVWTDDGRQIITTGHDERIRVWDAATTADTLANFGPLVKNRQLASQLPMIVPSRLLAPGQRLMLYPNGGEILVFDLLDGRLLKRLKPVDPGTTSVSSGSGQRNMQNRTTSMTWGVGNVEMFSAHTDGIIRAWRPRTREEVELDEDELREAKEGDADEQRKKRKRQVLDDIYRDLTKQKITFG